MLPGQAGGLGHEVGGGDGDLLGQGAVVELGEQRAPRVERLVALPALVGMTAWTMTSLPFSSRPAPSQPRTIGSRSAGGRHLEGQDVVVVQADGLEQPTAPAGPGLRVGPLADLEAGERVVAGLAGR